MADSFSVKAILSAQDRNFSSTFEKAASAAAGIESKIKSGLGFGVLAGIGSQAFSAITSGISGMVSELSASSAAWKTFEGNMSMLGKSADEIAGVKKELSDFATQTIYSASDMASTYSQLAAVGIKSTDKLVKGFGGLAAAAENPTQAMKTLSQQATQMAAKPMVQWQDFKLMLEQTPAGIAAVAKEMGKTTQQLVQDVQDGTVATEDFFDAIAKVGTNDAFTKLATQYKTVGQAMDGLKETVSVQLAPAFDVLSQSAINGIQGIIDKVGEINPDDLASKVQTGIDRIEGIFNAFANTGAVDAVATAFSKIGTAVGHVFDAITSNGGALQAFAGIVGTVVTVIANLAGGLADLIAAAPPGVINAIASALMGVGLALAAMKAISSISAALSVFSGGMSKLATSVGGGLAGKLTATAVGQAAVGSASAASAGQVLAAAAAFIGLGAGVALAAVGIKTLADAAISIASAGPGAAVAMLGMVAALAALAFGAALIGPALTAGAIGFLAFGAAIALVGAGALMAANALSTVAGVLPIVVTYGSSGAVAIAQLGVSMATFAVGAALAGAAAAILGVGLIAVGTGALMAAIGAALLSAAVIALGTGIMIAATGALMLGVALPLVASGGTAAGTALLTLGTSVLALAGGAVAATASTAALTLALTAGALAMAAFGASTLLASVGMMTLSVSLLMVNASLSSIQSKANQTASTLNAMVSAVSFVENALGALGNMAQSAMDKFIGAFRNAEGEARSAGQNIGNNIKDGIQNGLQPVPQIAQQAMNGFTQAVNAGGNQAVAAANSMAASIRSALASASNGAYSSGYQIGAGLASGMYSSLGAVRAAANALVAEANRAIQAKAQIHSPARLFMPSGAYMTEGVGVGMESRFSWLRKVAQKMVQIPDLPNFNLNHMGSVRLHDDYDYRPVVYVRAEVTSIMDNREVGYGTAEYVQEKNEFEEKRRTRLKGGTA